jgi:hypothetical protein
MIVGGVLLSFSALSFATDFFRGRRTAAPSDGSGIGVPRVGNFVARESEDTKIKGGTVNSSVIGNYIAGKRTTVEDVGVGRIDGSESEAE